MHKCEETCRHHAKGFVGIKCINLSLISDFKCASLLIQHDIFFFNPGKNCGNVNKCNMSSVKNAEATQSVKKR